MEVKINKENMTNAFNECIKNLECLEK